MATWDGRVAEKKGESIEGKIKIMQAKKGKSIEVLRNDIKAENGTGKDAKHYLLNGQQ